MLVLCIGQSSGGSMWDFPGHSSELAFPMVSRSFIGQRGATTKHRNTLKPTSEIADVNSERWSSSRDPIEK